MLFTFTNLVFSIAEFIDSSKCHSHHDDIMFDITSNVELHTVVTQCLIKQTLFLNNNFQQLLFNFSRV